MATHRFPIRVYYEDTDSGGVVYYANYLRYTERARTEFLRELGVDLAVHAAEGRHFVVTRVEADYRRPARYGELLEVTTTLRELRRASLTLEQNVTRPVEPKGGRAHAAGPIGLEAHDAETLVACITTMALVEIRNGAPRPIPIPPAIRTRLP